MARSSTPRDDSGMRAYLVRVGVDQAFGAWNAPIDPRTNEFVYVPVNSNNP